MAATKFHFLAFALALFLVSCARMAAPPGGPEDKTAPEIVLSSPAQGSVFVPLDSDVTLEFSEPVNRPTVEAALYLSPEPGRRLRYRWSGRRLTLDYLDPLPENRTIVVTVGAQAKDMLSNTLENSYTLAFSTGDHIDKGEIFGVVALPDGAHSISVVAYLLGDTMPDPMRVTPDYRMQTAEDGTFDLGYLATGNYRLLALDDKNFDGLWLPASEWIGTSTGDVSVEEGTKPFVSFVPTLQDTTQLSIIRARQIDNYTVNVRFNRDVQPDRLDVVSDSSEQTALYHRADTSSTASWFIYLDDTLSSDSADVRAMFQDIELSARFAVHARPDTTPPTMSSSWPVNRSATTEVPREIIAIFGEPIVFGEQTDSLKITVKHDTTEVEITAVQSDPAALTITPLEPFAVDEKYSLYIPKQLISDRSGNMSRDSLMKIVWYTYPADSLGTIEGRVRANELGPWLVELYAVKAKLPEQTIFTNATFKFEGYPAGDYRLRVIRDVNKNENFDTGRISPFEFSEPFQWHPDTVSVRPRWTADVEFLWTNVTK